MTDNIVKDKPRGACSMNKEKVVYHFNRYDGKVLLAKNEIPYHIQLTSRLLLDQLCYDWNKKQLQKQLDKVLIEGNKELFEQLSLEYRQYISG